MCFIEDLGFPAKGLCIFGKKVKRGNTIPQNTRLCWNACVQRLAYWRFTCVMVCPSMDAMGVKGDIQPCKLVHGNIEHLIISYFIFPGSYLCWAMKPGELHGGWCIIKNNTIIALLLWLSQATSISICLWWWFMPLLSYNLKSIVYNFMTINLIIINSHKNTNNCKTAQE